LKLDHYDTPADFYDARAEDGARGFPADPIYWESVVVQCDYRAKEIDGIKLMPIDLGYGRPRPQRGRPMMADAKLSQKILERMEQLSQPFGTAIEIEGNTGVIRL
jgi:hypothetical protein